VFVPVGDAVAVAVGVPVLVGLGVCVLVGPTGVFVALGPPGVTVLVGFGACVLVGVSVLVGVLVAGIGQRNRAPGCSLRPPHRGPCCHPPRHRQAGTGWWRWVDMTNRCW
jgi:hypothetical protein